MASATYLQSLDSVYEDGTSRGVTPSNRRQIETFIAKEVIAIGDWVAFDVGATADGDVTLGVYKADSNSVPIRPAVGVALHAATAAEDKIEVCISGVCNASVGDNGGAGNAIGTPLETTGTAGTADAAGIGAASSARSPLPPCSGRGDFFLPGVNHETC